MEYEGKIRVELSAGVTVEGENREDAKRKLNRLHERLVKFLESEGIVDEVYPWKQETYVYTDENWKPTPRLDDERYLVFENEGDRDYFEEYYDGDEVRIEDAVQEALEAELDILKEIEVGEIYFKRGYEWRNVRKDYYPCCHSDTAKGDLASNGDLVDAMFATGEDVDEFKNLRRHEDGRALLRLRYATLRTRGSGERVERRRMGLRILERTKTRTEGLRSFYWTRRRRRSV